MFLTLVLRGCVILGLVIALVGSWSAVRRRTVSRAFGTGCGILLVAKVYALAVDFLVGLKLVFEADTSLRSSPVYHFLNDVIEPIGLLVMISAAICRMWPYTPYEPVNRLHLRSIWAHWLNGKQLLAAAMVSLAILPVSAFLSLLVLKTNGAPIVTPFVVLLSIPSVVTWLLSSRYLEALRVEGDTSTERPTALWAYGVSSLGSIAAIFFALTAFIMMGLQQGWIRP